MSLLFECIKTVVGWLKLSIRKGKREERCVVTINLYFYEETKMSVLTQLRRKCFRPELNETIPIHI